MTALTLGFMPLTDCAPLVVAQEQGFFADEGLRVTLSREASWATIRDKVEFGALDAAHMLGPMVLAATVAGQGAATMIAPMALNRNGAGLSLSRALIAEIRSAGSLAEVVKTRPEPLVFAVVFPASIHNFLLRDWLLDQGVDPDRDLRIVVAPPQRMVDQLAEGQIDGFCAGSPWNSVGEATGAGKMLATSGGLAPGAPDKVLGLSEATANRDPQALSALLRALSRAAQWADRPDNREALLALLARPEVVGVAPFVIAPVLERELVFHADGASVPKVADAEWLLERMLRWRQIGSEVDIPATAARVYRPDLLQRALAPE